MVAHLEARCRRESLDRFAGIKQAVSPVSDRHSFIATEMHINAMARGKKG